MANEQINCDNLQLSEPFQQSLRGGAAGVESEILQSIANANSNDNQLNSCFDAISDHSVAEYVRSAVSENTRRAYRSDVIDFLKWGGHIPSSPETLAQYLADRAEKHSPFTLMRRLVAISQAHRALGFENPCSSHIVQATIKGIRRVHGLAQRQVEPILREDLLMMLGLLENSTRGIRDRALLLIGFCGAFRRSEVAQMQFDDVRFVPEGLTIRLSRSKTDQEGEGRLIAIPWGRSRACAVRSLKAWIEHAAIENGAVFRHVNKGGKVLGHGISGSAIAQIVKEHAARAGLNAEKISGHSLRAGLVTSAAKLGASSWKIRQQTGHKSEATLQKYVRDADLFNNNAAGVVL